MTHRRLIGSCSLLVAAGCWGGTYVASKYALHYVGPFALVLARYTLASVVFVPLVLVRGRDSNARGRLRLMAVTSFVGLGISSWTQFLGTSLSSAHAGAVITSSAPAFMVVFAAILLGERITPRKVAAVVIAGVGVTIVAGPGNVGGGFNALIGDALLVVAGLTWALYSVLIRKLTRQVENLTVTAYVTLFGVLFALPPGVPDAVRTGIHSATVVGGVLYIGFVSTALAYYLWNKGMELLEAGTASVFFFAQPVTGTFFSWLLLGEKLTGGFFLGSVLILAGVAIASFHVPFAANGETEVRPAPEVELAGKKAFDDR